MSGTYTLGDEGLETIRASEAFRDLPPEMGEALEEFLYTAFSGGNTVSPAQAKARLDRHLDAALPNPGLIRKVILGAMGVA
jgi:hypothetical protein